MYRGADGAFTLYEDENDTYDYEKGVYATIPIEWNEAQQKLTIGERKGTFPGDAREPDVPSCVRERRSRHGRSYHTATGQDGSVLWKFGNGGSVINSDSVQCQHSFS